jgi:hypothetical protein
VRILGAVHDLAERVETHRHTLAVGDDHALELVGVHQLPGGLQRVGAVRADDVSGGNVDVPCAQRVLDFVDPDLARRELMGIELCVHRVFLRAEDLHLGHAAHLRDALRDPRLGPLVQRPCRQRRRPDHEIENRLIGRVHLGEGWRSRHALRQQPACLRDRALHVDRGAVEASIEVELQRDLRRAE